MSCTNCFNGCTDTTSDKCVKYTGVDQPQLNITNGDSLFSVENTIILKILDMMVGVGVFPEIGIEDVCSQVNAALPPTGPYNLNDYLIAISSVACNSINSIMDIEDRLSALNSIYTMGCITASDPTDTHTVLQAVINYACTLNTQLGALALNVSTNYVKIADINSYIQAYLTSTAPSTLMSNKMIPYVAMEYYSSDLSHFDASGSGIGDWAKIYLCNGAHGTPDKRGFSPIGITNVVGGGPYSYSPVDPGKGNPIYAINIPQGVNNTTLSLLQIPPHTHIATVAINDPGHAHVITATAHNAAGSGSESVLNPGPNNFNTNSATTGIGVTVTNSSTGGGNSHSVVHPVLPCYYIMYIP